MAKDSQGSSHHLKVVGGAYGKRKDLRDRFKFCVNVKN